MGKVKKFQNSSQRKLDEKYLNEKSKIIRKEIHFERG
jgi:hypothetical protein